MTRNVHAAAWVACLWLAPLGCVVLVGCSGGTSHSSLQGGNTLGDLPGNVTAHQSGSHAPCGRGVGNLSGGHRNYAVGYDNDHDGDVATGYDNDHDGDFDDCND